MFSGLFRVNMIIAAIAGVSIILAAVYTLNMVQKVIYGELGETAIQSTEIKLNVKLALVLIALAIIALGIYPQPMINLTNDSVAGLIIKK
jgi:NADH-quinone oxidoreductase subunit M